uniref:Uncharacterized protein n=2 Tax=Anguilla anguilla TaxID=7936 RepID=A0A0E9VEW8_ANGAN
MNYKYSIICMQLVVDKNVTQNPVILRSPHYIMM